MTSVKLKDNGASEGKSLSSRGEKGSHECKHTLTQNTHALTYLFLSRCQFAQSFCFSFFALSLPLIPKEERRQKREEVSNKKALPALCSHLIFLLCTSFFSLPLFFSRNLLREDARVRSGERKTVL